MTSSAVHHTLDNNDNFSRDDRFLCFDTRDTLGPGPGNSTRIMKVDIVTGVESVVYEPQPAIVSATEPAPGVLAASFSPVADEVIFIHGPLVSEVPARGAYGKTNRRGAVVRADGSGPVSWLDYRDVTSAVTPPGAHRGGTHRHEYTRDGRRVGFTYDDHLLHQYGRTIGMAVPHPKAPGGATHWTTMLVTVAPAGTAKPGELEEAAGDSWVDRQGLMRAFIGKVREEDGSYQSSLFVVDVPASVDVTTADAGTATRFMTPPRGVSWRRLTHTTASGIVRGSPDGTHIAYFAKAPDGSRQVFLIPARGSDRDSDPAMRPVQATFLDQGAGSGVRWHPSGNSIVVLSDHGVAVTCVKPGPRFGVSTFLTAHGTHQPAAEGLVFSRSGRKLGYNQRVPAVADAGRPVKDASGGDFRQIFLVDFPDADGTGVADPIEQAAPVSGASRVVR